MNHVGCARARVLSELVSDERIGMMSGECVEVSDESGVYVGE